MSDLDQDIQKYKQDMPQHVCIIMDGNGRWAEQRGKPRIFGHRAGVEAVRSVVEACGRRDIEALTLFAFSSENWRRPPQEVRLLLELFLTALSREVRKLHKNGVKLKVIGDLSAFDQKLQQNISDAEELTRNNSGLSLNIAANYGGRWDITQAVATATKQLLTQGKTVDDLTPELIDQHICLHELAPPDLFIRTGGEMRISNFMLWQLSYCELYFTEVLWPDFDESVFAEALNSFSRRQRRLGRTGAQVEQLTRA